MPVRADRRSQSVPRMLAIPFPTKRPEGPPVLPGRADIIAELLEQRTSLAVFEQLPQFYRLSLRVERVTDATLQTTTCSGCPH